MKTRRGMTGSTVSRLSTLAKWITGRAARGLPERDLRATERRLGMPLPRVVRDCYLAIGRTPLATVFERLLPLAELELDRGRLVFVDEYQGVVQWGVPVAGAGPDARVDIRSGGEWFREHRSAAEFLAVTLCYNAVNPGGMPHIGSRPPRSDAVRRLNAGWTWIGQVNVLRAWARPGCVACTMKAPDHVSVYAAATTAAALEEVLDHLGRPLDPLADPQQAAAARVGQR